MRQLRRDGTLVVLDWGIYGRPLEMRKRNLTCHHDGTVTVWDAATSTWRKRVLPEDVADRICASLPAKDRTRLEGMRLVCCHACGDEHPQVSMVNRGGEWYCHVCDE